MSISTRRRIPKLRLHKPSGRAVVTLPGRGDVYCGTWETPAAHAQYDRVIAEWLAGGTSDRVSQKSYTVVECVADYLNYLERAHATDQQLDAVRWAVRDMVELYGRTPAAQFGPLKLSALRQRWLDAELSASTISMRIGHVRAVIRRACSLETIPPQVFHGLESLPPLRRGEAKPPRKVQPVPLEHVQAVRPFVSSSVWAAIEVLRLTAARPGEILPLRACDIDRSGDIWEYRPLIHKTAHHGRSRVIFFGPEAQAILRPFILRRRADERLFSPHDRFEERSTAALGHRRPDQPDTPRQTERRVGDFYDSHSFARCISRACRAAKVPQWSPYQLRHAAATAIRKKYGLEVAQVVLGHSTARVTEIYALVDETRARKAISEIG